ncbi:hypothetical protein BX600DRAFT_441119 [Xylariales sp. PMI_506]|nr:hypothetical protein BX600DRAFT_441119 [Xylariales sp. PMI_506]
MTSPVHNPPDGHGPRMHHGDNASSSVTLDGSVSTPGQVEQPQLTPDQQETLPLPLPPPPPIMEDERRTQSAPDAVGTVTKPLHSPLASPPLFAEVHPRTSLQLHPAPAVYPVHKVRASEEFDRRYDGPFGRPSLAMTRRRSSAAAGDVTPERVALEDIIAATDTDATTNTAANPITITKEPPAFQPEPPPLDYTLRTRKLAIVLFWFMIVFDSVVLPIALYFGLWYGVGPGNPADVRLSANTVFSIVTAAIGGASIVEYFVRFWRLWKSSSPCRVIGAKRWYLDTFHWMFSLGWIVIMIELIIGTVQENPPIRLLSMPLSTMLFVFGTLMLIIDVMRFFHVPAPVRISSVPKGAQLRPGIYSLIEDVCAVDGSGGTAFRVAFDRRYSASHLFRTMLRRLGVFWAVGAEACAALCTALVFGLENADISYVVGWSLPFVWAGVWAALTTVYVKWELAREKKLWAAEASKLKV